MQKFRNEKWRVFDFLWMLHTMDYATRDNFSNGLLRTFSLFGLVTILSGFVLFYVASPSVRKKKLINRQADRTSPSIRPSPSSP